jgi:hypothetical protein
MDEAAARLATGPEQRLVALPEPEGVANGHAEAEMKANEVGFGHGPDGCFVLVVQLSQEPVYCLVDSLRPRVRML